MEDISREYTDTLNKEETLKFLNEVLVETKKRLVTGSIDLEFWSNQRIEKDGDNNIIENKQREYVHFINANKQFIKIIEARIKELS